MTAFPTFPTTASAIAALQPHLPNDRALLWAGRCQLPPNAWPLIGFGFLFSGVTLLFGLGTVVAGLVQPLWSLSLMGLVPTAVGLLMGGFLWRQYGALRRTLYGVSQGRLWRHSPLVFTWWELAELPTLEARVQPVGTFTLGYTRLSGGRSTWMHLFTYAEGTAATVEAILALQKAAKGEA